MIDVGRLENLLIRPAAKKLARTTDQVFGCIWTTHADLRFDDSLTDAGTTQQRR